MSKFSIRKSASQASAGRASAGTQIAKAGASTTSTAYTHGPTYKAQARLLDLSTRAKLLTIAAGILVLTMILGLSAYITDLDSLTATFQTVAAGALDVTVTANDFTQGQTLYPNQQTRFNPAVENTGTEDIYGFIEILVPVDETQTQIYNRF